MFGSVQAAPTFTGPQSVDVIGFNIDIVTADVNGDGYADIVSLQDDIFDGDRSYLQVFINDGSGHFAAGQTLDLGLPDDFAFEAAITDLTTGDFNADHRPDFAVIGDSLQLSIIMNNGAGVLLPRVKLGLWGQIAAVVEAGDLDGDGDADLVFGHSPRVAINNGNLSFTVTPMTDDPNTAKARILHLNADAYPDVAYAYSVYVNDGAGHLTRIGQYPVAGGRSCGFGDFDHDGDNDVASPQPFGPGGISRVLFALNHGDGSFTSPTNLSISPVARIETGSINGDGHLDLVISHGSICGENGCNPPNFFTLVLGNGDGSFGAPIQINTPALRNVAVADFDRDGRDDIVISAGNLTGTDSTLSVFLNSTVGACQGDADGDGDVDLADYAQFASCFAGPGHAAGVPCPVANPDCDGDGDVDLQDYAAFSRGF
jgi:hypothetical protein